MLEIIPSSPKKSLIIKVPGSKSYTNRALLLAALAKGTSILKDPLYSEDTLAMIKALRQLGVKISRKTGHLTVEGQNGIFKKTGYSILNLENAGTAVRSLTAVMASQNFKSVITGNTRMQKRPIIDLVQALQKLNVKIKAKKDCPPVTINGKGLKGGRTVVKGDISSQYLSALLIAAPLAENEVIIDVKGDLASKPYIEMTLDIMRHFGVKVINNNFKSFKIKPQSYKATNYQIEGDASSASYPLALAAIHGTKITIKNVPSASKQADLKFAEVMRKMGCKVSKTASGISLRGPRKLKGLGTIDLNKLPDAAMTVAIVAALADSKTKITNIYNLRVKESDRIDALKNELTKLNIPAGDTRDSLTINPSPKNEIHGNTIKTYNDHRVAMCFAVLGSKIAGLKIHDPVCVQKTYPTFWKDLQNWGIRTKKVRHIQNPNIYLIGMRGCGKTTDGKLLAKNLKYKFIDMDDFIEKKEGLKIEQIVKTKGWPHFRKLESEACLELSKKQKMVIGTGGGAILKTANLRAMKKSGYIIFFNAPLELLIKRIEKEPNRPPLTNHKSLQKEMRHLWNERKPIYFKNADALVDASDPVAVGEKLTSAANLFIAEKS